MHSHNHNLPSSFAGCLRAGAALAIVGMAAGAAQAQVIIQKKPLPAEAVVKPQVNVLSDFPLGPGGKYQREIVALTNKERQQAGLTPLQVKRVLTAVAQRHALNMARQDKMSNQLDGKNVGDRLREAGYKALVSGENLACITGFPTAEGVVKGWMAMPAHRANLLNPTFTEVSIGLAKSGKTGDCYFCLVLAAPK